MVIDTSALVAVFLGEPERKQFLEHILQAETKLISAANSLETGIVLEARRGEAAGREFDLFIVRAKLEVVPVDAEQVEIARSAWRKYGKGGTQPVSTSEIASPTRWPSSQAKSCWPRERIFVSPTCNWCEAGELLNLVVCSLVRRRI